MAPGVMQGRGDLGGISAMRATASEAPQPVTIPLHYAKEISDVVDGKEETEEKMEEEEEEVWRGEEIVARVKEWTEERELLLGKIRELERERDARTMASGVEDENEEDDSEEEEQETVFSWFTREVFGVGHDTNSGEHHAQCDADDDSDVARNEEMGIEEMQQEMYDVSFAMERRANRVLGTKMAKIKSCAEDTRKKTGAVKESVLRLRRAWARESAAVLALIREASTAAANMSRPGSTLTVPNLARRSTIGDRIIKNSSSSSSAPSNSSNEDANHSTSSISSATIPLSSAATAKTNAVDAVKDRLALHSLSLNTL